MKISNVKLLLISAGISILICFFLYVMEYLLEYTYIEHIYVGLWLGVEFETADGFIPLPFSYWFFSVMLFFNYLSITLIIFIFLKIFTKIINFFTGEKYHRR